jgi:nucleotide-binding universal stress UspA family protein
VHNRWKILAPVDLRSEAEARVQHALNVAEALDGDLTLVYVIDGRCNRATPVEWPRSAMAAHRNYDVRRVVLAGSVAETVGRYADDLGADLVTLTAGPYRAWKRLWRKSATADIETATDRPVCFARRAAPFPLTGFRSVLCEVALDGTDDPCIRFSEEVAHRCDATLVLLHVVPEATEALLGFGVPGNEERPLRKQVAELRMRELTSAMSFPHLTAITTGSAYSSLAELAREHNADLVITGRRNGALSGVEADALLSRVSCPVISVPAGPPHLAGHSSIPSSLWRGHNAKPTLASRRVRF